MLHRHPFWFRLAVCAVAASVWSVRLAAQPVPGSYEISFHRSVNGVLEPVSSLTVCPACQNLIIKAHIEEAASGVAATGGSVSFQYCSLKGTPPGDITRADEAPSAACTTKEATWRTLGGSFLVDEWGDAFVNFGVVRIPRTIGFRFRYSGRRGGVASGTSAPADLVWVAAD